MKRGEAESLRRLGDEYRLSANEANVAEFRRVQFDNSSDCYGKARACDRDADAILIVITALEGRNA